MIKLVTGWWFSSSTPISFTDKTDRHDITEILLKVALNTISQTNHTTNKEFIIKSTGIDNDLGRHPNTLLKCYGKAGVSVCCISSLSFPNMSGHHDIAEKLLN